MTITIEKDVRVPMRDGVTLATDLYLPEGGPVPVLLVRLPYGKDVVTKLGQPVLITPLAFAEAGYAVVWQDCRGTWSSDGTFGLQVADMADGVDTLQWIRRQPWCDGNVGTYGPSYLGLTQWALASQGPDGLKAIAPTTAPIDFRYVRFGRGGGLFWHTNLLWAVSMNQMLVMRALRRGESDATALLQAAELAADPEPHLRKLPISDQPLLNKQSIWWQKSMEHPISDAHWAEVSPSERIADITTPGLHVGGWFDIFVTETTRAFTRLRDEAAGPEARQYQRLIIGPWDHRNQEGLYSDRQFGARANALTADVTGAHVRFFDHHLRGDATADAADAPVRIFVMGIDQWRDEQDWPLPDTRYVDYFLDGSGHANTAGGDGTLTLDAPDGEAADTIRYDPTDPVPTIGGRRLPAGNIAAAAFTAGPLDQSPVETREDVLCFTTPVLDEPLEVTGEVSLVLHVSSSARDTDFTGKLVDVFPDGRALYLTDGLLRARYRTSLTEPELLEPDRVYEMVVDLGPTANVFLPGHRLRLEVSSSNFPHYDRNTNTGGNIPHDVDEPIVAVNTILHGPRHPSRLILPIIERP
ncbi:CocE/NonD family hydrolase [Actinomadura sp. WMMB 499]|uniref:CocE/NonD family hydrolase n=1 Tax=Actinomadura sp. WMMB 499 TaxID=1219491 RepID=UPI00124689A1|nr:CocE/NonD family hydrolase [Actinomadura sp. WMMB 499]QFG22884.1 CocE/NonD family hydrolase [Actinomadura sp. WMMB 499]